MGSNLLVNSLQIRDTRVPPPLSVASVTIFMYTHCVRPSRCHRTRQSIYEVFCFAYFEIITTYVPQCKVLYDGSAIYLLTKKGSQLRQIEMAIRALSMMSVMLAIAHGGGDQAIEVYDTCLLQPVCENRGM